MRANILKEAGNQMFPIMSTRLKRNSMIWASPLQFGEFIWKSPAYPLDFRISALLLGKYLTTAFPFPLSSKAENSLNS